MKIIVCSNRYRCAGMKFESNGVSSIGRSECCFDGQKLQKAEAVRPETQPAASDQRGIPHDQEAIQVCGGAGIL